MIDRRKTLFMALALLVVAGGLALLRSMQREVRLAPAEVRFIEPHAFSWNPETRELAVTGGDPFAYLTLPPGNVPLTRLTLVFEGPPREGGWYVYPAPAELPVVTIDQKWVETAKLSATPDGGFEASWQMRPSRAVRIDLPDDLFDPLLLRGVELESPFVSGTNAVFGWMTVCGLLGGILLLGVALWPWARHPAVQLAVAATLIAGKLWLVSDFGQTIHAHAMHDDKLFMDQGMTILAGGWLGDFWQLTLAKGPSFSIFLALSSATGLPLQLNEILFHALACVVLLAALAPWLRHPAWRLALLLVLLFEPHALSAELYGRVLRGGIQPALTLLTLAGWLGLLTRADRPLRGSLGWGLLAGLAGAAFWYSREEGIWLAPSVLLLFAATVLHGWRSPFARPRWRWVAALVLPWLVFEGARQSLRWTNAVHYGVSMGVDVSEGAFPAAYGAMLRVTQPDPIPGVPVTQATRALIYPHSPALAEMRELMEGEMTRVWARSGWAPDSTHPRAFQEIRGGWFQWALRAAASKLGHYASAPKAEAYWQRMADEINAAVDEGRLDGGAARHGFFPVWHDAYTTEIGQAWLKAIDLLVRFTDFKAQASPSIGTPEEIETYAAFLHARPMLEQEIPRLPTHGRMVLYRLFRTIGWTLTGVALVCTFIVVRRAWRTPDARFRLAVLAALWGGACALALVCALVHVTSFYAVIGAYLGPAVPMVLACWVLAPCWAFECREKAEGSSADLS